ncbi:MAG TPA: alpha/beta hydrolase [Caulobacteraceae bacterium]
MSRIRPRWTRRAAIAAGAAASLAGLAHAEDLPWRLPKLRRAAVHGRHIAYFEMGSGPPLVLIHGMSGSPALEWGRVMTPLSRRFRVIAPYQIGFGPSDQPELPYDAATFVDYLGGFLNARAAEGATLVGESFGGWVVTQYALRQGQKSAWRQTLPPISHLAIVDGSVQPSSAPQAPGAQSIDNPDVGKRAHAFFLTQPAVDNSRVHQGVAAHMAAQSVSDEALKTIRTPTLVIWGREDQLIPVADGRRIAAQIPGARSVIIGDCGHIPSVEQPRAFLGALGGLVGVALENLS